MASVPRSARILRALATASCLFSVIGACGGRSDTRDYLYNADGTISEGATESTGASSSFGGTPSAAGTNNGRGGTPNHGGVSNTGATGPNGGTGIVVGGSAPIAGATAIGGSGLGGSGFGGSGFAGSPTAGAAGAPFTPVSCGAELCDANTQSCCAGFGGLHCIGQNQDCNGAVLGCTTNKDCAGNDVCCISITGDVNAASSCKARCNTMGTGRDRQLCDTAADCLDPFRFCTATIFGLNICTRRP